MAAAARDAHTLSVGSRSPFVGREAEAEALRDLMGRLPRDARPHAALVVGDPGVGKSRLLREVLSGPTEMPLLRVVGYEPEQQVPLAAAAELLRSLTKASDGSSLESLLQGPDESDALDPIRIF